MLADLLKAELVISKSDYISFICTVISLQMHYSLKDPFEQSLSHQASNCQKKGKYVKWCKMFQIKKKVAGKRKSR